MSNTCGHTDVISVKYLLSSLKNQSKISQEEFHTIRYKNHFRSTKYDTNPPPQKSQDKTVQNFQIFKLQNRGGNGHFKVDKYEEIEKSL